MAESDHPRSAPEKLERLSEDTLKAMEKSDIVRALQEAYSHINNLEQTDIQLVKESEEKYKQQLAEVTRRETLLLKTLTEKEREINELASQIDELKQFQLPSNNQLRSMLLDPTVNVVINRLKKELDNTKQRLEESQTELSAWKFTQDSQTGKQLMARCRTLLKENEELGKQISQGRIAKLEGEIALEKKLVEEMKVAQSETEQFVMELDDDTEGLQATVYLLQQQLKEANKKLEELDGGTQSTTNTIENELTVIENGSSHSHQDYQTSQNSIEHDSSIDDAESKSCEGVDDEFTNSEAMDTTTEVPKSEHNSKQKLTNGFTAPIVTTN